MVSLGISFYIQEQMKKIIKHKKKRNFHTSSCDEKWATDVSEFHIAAGKFYLSPIRDLHNRKIISYSISSSPNFSQTIEMLDKAFE